MHLRCTARRYTGVYWSIHSSILKVYWSILEYTSSILKVYWSIHSSILKVYWSVLEYTGIVLALFLPPSTTFPHFWWMKLLFPLYSLSKGTHTHVGHTLFHQLHNCTELLLLVGPCLWHVGYWHNYTVLMSPTLNGRSVTWCFEHSNELHEFQFIQSVTIPQHLHHAPVIIIDRKICIIVWVTCLTVG